MRIKSPCLRCKRKDEDKNKCGAGCPARIQYSDMYETAYSESEAVDIMERLDQLARKHVEQMEPVIEKPAKRKYTKRKKKNKEHSQEEEQIEKIGETVKQDFANPDVIKLYMSKYPEIATYVFENAETFLLPARHVIMTLLAEAIIARKNASPTAC